MKIKFTVIKLQNFKQRLVCKFIKHPRYLADFGGQEKKHGI